MSFFTTLVSSKLAVAAVAVGTVAVGGTVAAAATGTIPTLHIQNAHARVAVPADTQSPDETASPDPSETPSPEPSDSVSPSASESPDGPDASGPAAFGLCTAYTKGGLDASSTAYGSLVSAAGGASNIATYCATIVHPGQSASHRPSALPTQASAGTAHRPAAPGVGVTPTLPTQAASGMAHAPTTHGRP